QIYLKYNNNQPKTTIAEKAVIAGEAVISAVQAKSLLLNSNVAYTAFLCDLLDRIWKTTINYKEMARNLDNTRYIDEVFNNKCLNITAKPGCQSYHVWSFLFCLNITYITFFSAYRNKNLIKRNTNTTQADKKKTWEELATTCF